MKHKKIIYSLVAVILLMVISYFGYQQYREANIAKDMTGKSYIVVLKKGNKKAVGFLRLQSEKDGNASKDGIHGQIPSEQPLTSSSFSFAKELLNNNTFSENTKEKYKIVNGNKIKLSLGGVTTGYLTNLKYDGKDISGVYKQVECEYGEKDTFNVTLEPTVYKGK